MSKKGIISLSIITLFIVLIGILFGTVFCLHTQNVTVLGNDVVSHSKNEIVSAADLKKGQSIFMIDKETATRNIEAKFPKIKVVQIKTTNITTIDIVIRVRHEMFYTEFTEKYYVLDEDLKVLKIIAESEEGQPSNEPTELTYIETGVLNINNSTKVCDFVGSDYQKQITSGLYNAMITTVIKTEHEQEVYFDRADVKDMLKNIDFEEYETFNKIIITTKYGVKLDIENPTRNMQNKINICFSTIQKFLTESNDKEKSGTIKIYYELDGQQRNVYIP